MQKNLSDYDEFVSDQVVGTAIVLIVIGAFMATVTFLGCCGILSGNSCMVKTYATLVGLFLAAELGTAVAIYVYKGDIDDIISDGMKKTIAHYNQPEFKVATRTWDQAQSNFTCCGVDSYTDWLNVKTLKDTKSVPDSCCLTYAKDCGKGVAAFDETKAKKTINTDGCYTSFVDLIKDHINVAAGIGVAIGVFQLITVIASCCLGRKMDHEGDYF